LERLWWLRYSTLISGGKFMSSRIFLTLLALAMAAVLVLTDRPWGLTSSPRVEELAALPDDPRLEPVRRFTQWGPGVFPYVSERAKAAAKRADPPLKLGRTYREWNMLGMPFYAAAEPYDGHDLVTYLELSGGIKVAVIDGEQRALIEDLAGRSLDEDEEFAWYEHLWGWLFVIGILVWHGLSSREIRRAELAEREAERMA
jgi:hypothetical protein